MGCRISHEKRRSIKRQNHKKEISENKSSVKVLLLGSGESGKSTVAKQMKIIHGSGYDKAEREQQIGAIQLNVLQFMSVVIMGMKKLDILFFEAENKGFAEKLLREIRLDSPLEVCVDLIKPIIVDKGFLDAIQRGHEFQINETHISFINSIDRIVAQDYIPTDDDILRIRIKTSGIYEYSFPYNQFIIRMIDVGGQRSERKKWIYAFEDVRAVIYVASLIDYCMVLDEDNLTNRMAESVKLFDATLNNLYFSNSPVILFLNKKDLFKMKLQNLPLSTFFPKYSGDDFDSAVSFIKTMYLNTNKIEGRSIYTHVTTATDTINIKFIFDSISDIILQNNLKETGLMN